LVQLHHYFENSGESEFVAQRDIKSFIELQQFFGDHRLKFPPPDGARWLAVDSSDPHFLFCVMEGGSL
jgi:hypothetical protein